MEYDASHSGSSQGFKSPGRILGSGKREREESDPSQPSPVKSQSASQVEREEEEEANAPPPELDEVRYFPLKLLILITSIM